MDESNGSDGFAAYFKRYTRTWVHGVATAALTGFGLLTFVHRAFAVVAILAYVGTPVVLYLRGSRSAASPATDTDGTESGVGEDETEEAAGVGETDGDADADGVDADADGTDVDADVTDADEAESDVDTDDLEADADETASDADRPERAWTTVDVPTSESLLDVAVAGGTAYAVGDEGSVLVGDGDGWSAALSDGPRAQSNALRGVAAVDEGTVWFAGDSGAVGRFDADAGGHVDHSAPDDDTTNVVDVAAAGSPGDETVLLVDGSGRVRRGRCREGEVAWDDPVEPGSGSSLAAVTLDADGTGYACDTNQAVFETTDGGRSFDRVGLDDAEGTLTGVAADGGRVLVGADDGVVHRRGDAGWTPERVGEDALWALAVDGGALACGDGGVVYERAADAADWERVVTPASGPLRGVAAGGFGAVAVGEDGAVVERTAGGT